MSVETLRVVRCDRCGREIDDQKVYDPNIDPGAEREALVEFRFDEKVVKFTDLCGKCEKRVGDLQNMVSNTYKKLEKSK